MKNGKIEMMNNLIEKLRSFLTNKDQLNHLIASIEKFLQEAYEKTLVYSKNAKEFIKNLSLRGKIIAAVVTLVVIVSIFTGKNSRNENNPPASASNNTSGSITIDTNSTILTGMSIESSNDNAVLHFPLSQKTTYKVSRIDDTISIKFINTSYNETNVLPPIKNSVVKNIAFKKNEKDTIAELKINNDYKISQLQLVENPSPELVIRLQKSIIAASNENQFASIRKTASNTMENASPFQKASKEYEKALTVLLAGNIPEAMADMEGIISLSPTFIPARETLATLLIKQNQSDEAEVLLVDGLKNNPHYGPFIILETRLLLEKGDLQKASSVLSNLVPDHDNAADYYALLGIVNLKNKNFIAAQRAYQLLVDLQPDDARWWVGLGIASLGLGNENSARAAYEQASKLGSLDWRIQSYLANHLRG